MATLPPIKITTAILQQGKSLAERALLAAALSKGYPKKREDTIEISADTYNPDQRDATSDIGTPIYGRIVLGENNDGFSNDYTDNQGNPQSYPTLVIDCAIIVVDYNQQVIRTNIQGRGNSIKEYISSGDNDVTITGIFTSLADQAPYDFINAINNIFNASVSIPVTNTYLNLLGINYLVLMPGCQLPQVQGGIAIQNFTIKAVSDTPLTAWLP